ncbi:DUF2798 domain-containing protein [Algoriphagus aestuariicola]|uniref:DUF2798 domain-containing protein n=1 Tax=Algoriphagus aestuariicola TaxID=1852016 RepID=A0ABS3BKZ3_9BACT|nr:DUF2798 domain-containing protein [Algoriphagus aestuariicola]MBN7799952.1 DUF2798 domain-containing protein [Algoriphagus aestuariicola]
MKQKIAFALLMGIVTTGIISFVLVSLNLGWPLSYIDAWLQSWAVAYIIVIPAILLISPVVEKLVHLLIPKK